MKIAVIFNSDFTSWPMGGMISYINNIISMLQDTYELELWGCEVDGKPLSEVSIDGREYEIHKMTKAKSRKKIVPNVVKCFFGNAVNADRLNKADCEILYFHLAASELGWELGSSFMSKQNKKRPFVILHQHGMAYKNKIGDSLNCLAMDKADLVFFTTDKDSLRKHKENIKNKNVVWMPSTVDTSLFKPVSGKDKAELRKQLGLIQSGTIFVFTGRITAWKNPLLLLEAFKEYLTLKNDKSSQLIYVGSGDCESELKEKVNELSLEKNVVLMGTKPRGELIKILQASDIFVMPSKGEGVSVSSIEALAVGLPIVAFNVEGMRGLVEEKAGYLAAEQTASAFARGMIEAVKHKADFSPRDIAMQYDKATVKKMMIEAIERGVNKGEQQW